MLLSRSRSNLTVPAPHANCFYILNWLIFCLFRRPMWRTVRPPPPPAAPRNHQFFPPSADNLAHLLWTMFYIYFNQCDIIYYYYVPVCLNVLSTRKLENKPVRIFMNRVFFIRLSSSLFTDTSFWVVVAASLDGVTFWRTKVLLRCEG